jgi:hypothetical protein
MIAQYLQLQRAWGKGFRAEQRILQSPDNCLSENGSAELDLEQFTAWCNSQQHLASAVRRN